MIFWSDYKIPKFNKYTFKRKHYLDVIAAFDCEVTTFFKVVGKWVTQDYREQSAEYFKMLSEADKIALPYIWQMGLNDDVVYGREMSDFIRFLNRIHVVNKEGILIVYVHNLGYDFEHFCEYTPSDTKVFAKAPFKPMYVKIPSWGIEFRCSYMLTNMSLATCAKEFHLNESKATGELDYTVARTPLTPLTSAETEYCERDIKVIIAMLRDVFLNRYSCIADIPLTQTGEVRREVKELLLKSPFHRANMERVKPDLKMYRILTDTLAGGYTHCNGLFAEKLLTNVDSYDKASSYPDIMCTRKFPSEKWHECKILDDFEKYAYLIHVRFNEIEAVGSWAYISAHKCKSKGYPNKDGKPQPAECDNGKIYRALWVEMWCTELDYQLIKRCYSIKSEDIICAYRSYKEYLPKVFIEYLLKLYNDKTTLKGNTEQQALYMRSKQRINAGFGMMLSSLVHDELIFNAFSHL